MKTIGARRVTFRVGDFWESPVLHILLTKEDNVVVARCLDFTVSAHGQDEKDAMKSLTEVIKEYVITAIENDAIESIYDSAHSKYWRMYNEIESRQVGTKVKKTLKNSFATLSKKEFQHTTAEMNYA